MPGSTQKSPCPFSTYRGKNISLLNEFIVKGDYHIGHGQFLLQYELVPTQTFDLDIRGKGIIKIGAFPSKTVAEEWVRSRTPLGNGSIRIRTTNLLRYKVSIPFQGGIILSTKKKHRQNHLAGSVLAFDIEYGDAVVMVLNGNNHNAVQFDTVTHSRHIEIVNSSKVCHASLQHYNPTSLCTPQNLKLAPGQLFKLEVRGPDNPRDTGSYVRACVSRMCHEYSNGLTRCEGTRDKPECLGKRLMIRPGKTEIFFLRVLDDGICVERSGETIFCLNSPITRYELGLWFEMHRVEMRLWLLRVKIDGEMPDSDDDPPPEYPAPPPPRQVKRQGDWSPDETSLSSEGSCKYISIQRDDDVSSYVTVDSRDNCCEAHDSSWGPGSDETYKPGMFGTETCSQPPPLPPKPCTRAGKFGGRNRCPERFTEPDVSESEYMIMQQPTQDSSERPTRDSSKRPTQYSSERPTQYSLERCRAWVGDQLQPLTAHHSEKNTTDLCCASRFEDSSFFIDYSRSETHQLDINLQDVPGGSDRVLCHEDFHFDLPDSPLSLSSTDDDFGFSQDERLHLDAALGARPPRPCRSRQGTTSSESASVFSEMSIDQETDKKTIAQRKSSNTSSSCEGKNQDERENFCWHRLLQTQSSTESESEDRNFPHPFLHNCTENELSKNDNDIVYRKSPKIRRNIVESSCINISQDSFTQTVEDGPICILPNITKSEMMDRSSTIKRNLNEEAKEEIDLKRYNSK